MRWEGWVIIGQGSAYVFVEPGCKSFRFSESYGLCCKYSDVVVWKQTEALRSVNAFGGIWSVSCSLPTYAPDGCLVCQAGGWARGV